jgi:hypothetical protein
MASRVRSARHERSSVSVRVAAALALLTALAAGVWAVGYGLGWEHRP